MLIEASKPEQLTALGQQIKEVGVSNLNRANFATITYESGIKKFDEALQGIPFRNTDCLSTITAFENGVLFSLLLNNATPLAGVFLMREQIFDFEIVREVEVEAPEFNRFKAVAGSMLMGAGGIGAALSSLMEANKNRRLDFRIIASKREVGSILKMRYLNENNGVEEILYSAPKRENHAIWVEDFIARHWKKETQLKSDTGESGCMFIVFLFISATAILCF